MTAARGKEVKKPDVVPERLIEGVKVKRLRVLPDERGWLMEILRCDDEIFEQFGQVYITTAYPGVIKAWHYHKKQTDYLCVIKGMAKVVLFDARTDSPTYRMINEFFMGERNPLLVKVPPMVYHGFKAIGNEVAYVLNCPTLPYDYENPDEYRVPYDSPEVGYDWEIKMG